MTEWHKYPDVEPSRERPLLVIYEHMSRQKDGTLRHDSYQVTFFTYVGKKSAFGKEGYKIRYWSYLPELPEEVKND